MKNRIIALFCTLALLLPCVTVNAAFSDVPQDTEEEYVLNILSNLGIINGYEDGTFKPEAPITRAEFVTIIHNSIRLWNNVANGDGASEFEEMFKELYMTDGSEGMELIYPNAGSDDGTVVSTGIWTDVQEDYWAYRYMKMLATFGYVVGYPDGTFKPTKTVTYNEAITVLLNVCGYKEIAAGWGGFPDGYNKLASRYNLSKGLYATGYMELSRMDAARLIYNAFDMKMAPTEVDENDEGRTFLNDVVGMYLVKGTLTDTDITSVTRGEGMSEYQACVGDVTFTFDKDDVAIRDYIGQELLVYLSVDSSDSSKYHLESFELIGKEDITVIDADLFEDYSDETFYYKNDKDDNNNKKLKVRRTSVLVYNGKYRTGWDKELFENINKGTITIIEKRDLDYDIIIVEDFKSGYTEMKNTADLEIYDNIAQGVGNSIISLKNTDSESLFIYQLMDANGETMSFENVGTGAVNYYINDNYVKVYYSDKTVNGFLKKEVDEDEVYYVVDNERYKISDIYMDYISQNPRYNLNGTITLDRYNEVVWMSDSVDMTGYAYIFKSRYDNENDQALITYYDISSGGVKEKVVVNEKVKFYGTDGQVKDYSRQQIVEELQTDVYDGIAKVELNDAGEIKRIRLALADAEEASDKLMLIRESENLSYTPTEGFSGDIYLNSDSQVILIPLDKTDYTNFKKLNYNSNLYDYKVKLYTFNPESPYAKVALMYQRSTSSGLYVDTKNPTYLVTKVVETINDDGELAKEVTLYDGTNYTTVISTEDEEGKSVFDKAFTASPDDKATRMKVERGDFIMCWNDDATGEVANVRVIFDANAVNPAWCGGSFENKDTKCTLNHTHITDLGNFPGTTGYYDRTAGNAHVNSNPVGYLSYGFSGYERHPGSANNRQFFMFGFVNQINEGMYEWTTQYIRSGWNGEKNKTQYQWAYDNFTTYNPKVYIINEDMTVETGNLQSIKTYKQAGSKCSKVLIKYIGGRVNQIWILPD